MKKAVIYCRTSAKSIKWLDTDEYGEKNPPSGKTSLDLQKVECLDYAKRNNLEVAEEDIYEDNNYSCITYPEGYEEAASHDGEYQDTIAKIKSIKGKEFRPGLGRLMARIQCGDIDAVIVRNQTRLMRAVVLTNLLQTVFHVFKKHGVVIHQTEGSCINVKDFKDVFMAQILSMSEIDSMLNKIESSRRGIRAKQKSGGLYGKMDCFGFDQKSKEVIPIPDELDYVKKIFKMFLAGKPLSIIAQMMNKAKVETKRGGQIWRRGNILDILKRPLYAGRQFTTNEKEDTIEVNFLKGFRFPISHTDFLKVQKLLETHKPTSRHTANHHPLSGLLYCGYCGRLMTISTGTNIRTKKSKHFYRCRSKRDNTFRGVKSKCNSNVSAYRDMDRDDVRAFLTDFKTFRPNGLFECLTPLFIFRLILEFGIDEYDIPGQIAIKQAELDSLEHRLKRLFDKWGEDETDGLFDSEMLRRKELRTEIQNLKSQQISKYSKEDLFDFRTKNLLQQGLIKKDLARRFAHDTFQRINIFHDKIEVTFKGVDSPLTIPRMVYYTAMTLPFAKVDINEEMTEATIHYFLKTYFTKGEKTKQLAWSYNGFEIFFVGSPA